MNILRGVFRALQRWIEKVSICSRFSVPGILMVGAISITAPVFAKGEKVTVAADPWCPMTCEKGSAAPGLMIELIRESLSREGMELEYLNMPWDEAVKKARAGEINGIVGASKNDAPDFVFPKAYQARLRNHIWVKASNKWEFKGEPSLKSVSIGVISAYSYGRDLDPLVEAKHPSMKVYTGEEPLISMIQDTLAGKITGFSEDENVLTYNLQQKKIKPSELKKATAKPTNADPALYCALSPKKDLAALSKKVTDALDKHIPYLKKEGFVKKLATKYGVKDF